jgi:hypothetical protein
MLKRGAALKLTPGGHTVGRFFPKRCHHEVNDYTQTVTMHFTGTGFAWTPVAGRIGFSAEASVEYRMDFWLGDEAMYVWAKTHRIVRGPDFQIGAVENKVVDWVTKTPAGYIANTFGSQIVTSQLASGFTVVRTDSGDEFAIGHLTPPQRPPKPFNLPEGDRIVYANETTEIHTAQVDVLGPFEVADSEQALFFRFVLQGPPVDVLIYHRGVGDLWRESLQLGAPLAPPQQPPLASLVVQPGSQQSRKVPLPPGRLVAVGDCVSAEIRDQAASYAPPSLVSWRAFVPSAAIIHISVSPPRLDVNAISLLSGDQAGR